jgi:phenylpropionate dioxygenase-like ring-hydroxylating dioxygenase large terminal subunit
MSKAALPDAVLLDDWHVIADRSWLKLGTRHHTMLLGIPLLISISASGAPEVRRGDTGTLTHTGVRYGLVWACLGSPQQDILLIPEALETDRHVLTGGAIGVNVSGLRAVENFLDLGHLPFVHTNYLGVESHSEVVPYDVDLDADGGLIATNCKFFQPIASPSASGGIMTDYMYKVFRPYTVALYKTNPVQPARKDFIALFVQPVDEEHCIAHSLLCYLKDGIDAGSVRWFMQLIFAQDKPILENHIPKRLPLDPRAETPIQADKSSIAYRRWLKDKGVAYGAIPG